MARSFDSAIEHLDEIGAWIGHLFDRAIPAGGERQRALDDALAARIARIEERLAAGRERGEPLPWDRLRVAPELEALVRSLLEASSSSPGGTP